MQIWIEKYTERNITLLPTVNSVERYLSDVNSYIKHICITFFDYDDDIVGFDFVDMFEKKAQPFK